MRFDVVPEEGGIKDRKVAHTFLGLPATISAARFEFQAKPGMGGLNTENDHLNLGCYGVGLPGTVLGARLSALSARGPWRSGRRCWGRSTPIRP
jgi:hypothetical protein